jgi:vitamin B12 transporter
MDRYFGFFLICLPLAMARGEFPGDTARTYYADEIVVTATRTAILSDDAPSPIQVLDAQAIQQINGTTAADLLRTANGVVIKDYGTVGGIRNVAFRGLSTENVLLLLDGNPINDPEYGSVDLSLLPLDAIDRMEVSYGSSSALYGGNALGGVVNMITRRPSDNLHARIQEEGGSFGSRRTSTNLEGRVAGIGLLGGFSRETGVDDFPFLSRRLSAPDTTLSRMNADYQRTHLFLNGDYQPDGHISLNGAVQYVKFERGLPGPLSSPSDARQNDEIYRVSSGLDIHLDGGLHISLGGIYNHNNEIYRDPEYFYPTDLTYKNKVYSLHSQVEWLPASWDRIVGGLEYSGSTLNVSGVSFGYPFLMTPVRIQRAAFISNEILLQGESDWFDRISLYQTARYDEYSDVKNRAYSPKLGVNIRISKRYDVRLRSSIGRNFRVPTLNDLYYPNFSNPDLSPEHSTAFDAGISCELDRSGRQTLGLTYFSIVSTSKIAYDANYVPYNVGKADNAGLEIRYDYRSSDDRTEVHLGFTFVDAIKKDKNSPTDSTYGKQLPYVPKSSGTFGVSFETELGRIGIDQSVAGLRYTTADNGSALPAYVLTDISIVKKISLWRLGLAVRCGVSNVFDIDYQIVQGYPMPGRSYTAGVSIEY